MSSTGGTSEFLVIKDGAFGVMTEGMRWPDELDYSEIYTEKFTFELPSYAKTDSESIISLTCPVSNPGTTKTSAVKIKINGHKVKTIQVKGDLGKGFAKCTLNEVVGKNILKKSTKGKIVRNIIEFTAVGDPATGMELSDVVLWYRTGIK